MGRPRTCNCGECKKCKHRIAQQKFNDAHPGYAVEATRKRRAAAREYERDRYQNDPVFRAKKKARNMVSIRLARGTMQRQPCEVCGAEPAEAHHDDYSKPLIIRWLCKPHHEDHHNGMG